MRTTVVVVILVALFGFGARSFGNIVLYSIDDEDGSIRSDEDGGETEVIRIGGGESEGRTFVSILSFDTSSLSGSYSEGDVYIRLAVKEQPWIGDGQIAFGEEGWVNPDDEEPWMDVAEYFGDDPNFEWSDRDADGPGKMYASRDDSWGFDQLEGENDILEIYLNQDAVDFVLSKDNVQFKIGTNIGPGSGDAWDYSAIDFYDGEGSNDPERAALVLVPEPATMLLLGLGGLLSLRRRRS